MGTTEVLYWAIVRRSEGAGFLKGCQRQLINKPALRGSKVVAKIKFNTWTLRLTMR